MLYFGNMRIPIFRVLPSGFFAEVFTYYLCFLPFLLILFFVARSVNKKRGVDTPALHAVSFFTFALYITAVLTITGTATLYDFLRRGVVIGEISVAPFSNADAWHFNMNIYMFVPWGFLLPLLFRGKNYFAKTALSGLAFSLAIEVSQLFTMRAADIDDLICNTLGAIIGFAIYKLIFRKRTHEKTLIAGMNQYVRLEPWVITAMVFILRFFISPLFYLN